MRTERKRGPTAATFTVDFLCDILFCGGLRTRRLRSVPGLRALPHFAERQASRGPLCPSLLCLLASIPSQYFSETLFFGDPFGQFLLNARAQLGRIPELDGARLGNFGGSMPAGH